MIAVSVEIVIIGAVQTNFMQDQRSELMVFSFFNGCTLLQRSRMHQCTQRAMRRMPATPSPLRWSGHAESEQGFVNATRPPTQQRTSQRPCQENSVWISLLARRQQEAVPPADAPSTTSREGHLHFIGKRLVKGQSRSRIHPASGPEAPRPGAPSQVWIESFLHSP